MNIHRVLRRSRWIPFLAGLLALGQIVRGAAPEPPSITRFSLANGLVHLEFTPFPATQEYKVWRTDALGLPFAADTSGVVTGFTWEGPAVPSDALYRLEARTLSPDELYATTLFDRIAYGPTPDELERVIAMGPAAYLEEQLAPEKISEDLDAPPAVPPPPPTVWTKVVAHGTATIRTDAENPDRAGLILYVYLRDAGEAYVDDIRLVAGSVDDDTKPNLLTNGDFENPLENSWNISPNHSESAISTDPVHEGGGALHIVASGGGALIDTVIWQQFTGVNAGDAVTLSWWYLKNVDGPMLTVRLAGSGVGSTVDPYPTRPPPPPPYPGLIYPKLGDASATLNDLRAWHLLHAIQSKRQLLEVLRQFCENHFVTQYSKSRDYFDGYYNSGTYSARFATQQEFKENLRWRQALLNPQCTFLDLLTISAESPAMIMYLDTVNSKGNSGKIANENYARELCELFCFGVDNGYEQHDIVQISRAWTGWSVDYLAPGDENNPFAARSTVYLDPNATNKLAMTNRVGSWALRFKSGNHYNVGPKYLFYQGLNGKPDISKPKTVPDRFGPWAGKPYNLTIPMTTGNAGMQDGYDVIQHMANQPFAMEFISAKLCRLFVHDDFHHGINDFSQPDTLSPEGKLVFACMQAWDNPPNGGPKGQIRDVLRVIFSSELFRSHSGSLQKVRTPLEYAVAAVRALRAKKSDGTYTSTTDGYALLNILSRAGRMRLFDRIEPDGYPEDAPGWISAGTLSERVRFVQSALGSTSSGIKDDAGAATVTDPVALLRLKRPDKLADAEAVVDYVLGILFPAEGAANLAAYRQIAINFLNTTKDGKTSSPFQLLSDTTTEYDTRVRGMVAMLMSTQRFHEQ